MTQPAAPSHAVLELEHFLPYRLVVLSNRISQDDRRASMRERFGLASPNGG